MQNPKVNNKRLAKNTILLYVRMIVVSFVSLYTARLVLQLLGVEDYGIYNVIGGIIGFMGIITGTMSSATQRFLSYDLGNNDIKQYQRTFSMLLNIFACFSLIGIFLLEIIGPWFIAKHLTIPENRLFAAQIIFQFTIVIFATQTMLIPFQSSIISHEKMGIYAYFTIFDVIFKLLVVYVLYFTKVDRLITYGFLYLCISLFTNGIYFFYCKYKIPGCRYIKYWDNTLFRRMSSFAGWNLFGSLTTVLNTQGQAILLNIFFGPTVNAAKAIADKINQIVSSFVTNFFMALSPQIIKTYATGDIDYTQKLVLKSSKFSVYLLIVLSFPLIFCMKPLLCLWLGESQVSFDMVKFCQLILVYFSLETLHNPLTQLVRATGNIKRYQIIIGTQTLLFLPFCYIAFTLGCSAYTSLYVLIIVYSCTHISRVYIACPIIQVSVYSYISKVVIPITLTWVVSFVLCFITIPSDINSILSLILYLTLAFTITIFSTFILGMNKKERSLIVNYIIKKCRI